MNSKRRSELIKYLYPTNEVFNFMYGDMYIELAQIIPKRLCFSIDNLKSENRANNYKIVFEKISKFIDENKLYKEKLFEFFPHKNYKNLILDIIVGYTFYLTPHINRNTGADVLADRRSVCYSCVLLLDLM